MSDYQPLMSDNGVAWCSSRCQQFIDEYPGRCRLTEGSSTQDCGTICLPWAIAAAKDHAAMNLMRIGSVEKVERNGCGGFLAKYDGGLCDYDDPADAILAAREEP